MIDMIVFQGIPTDQLTYLGYVAWITVGILMTLTAYQTFIGLIQLFRLKLRTQLLLSLEFWFISIGYTLQLTQYFGPILWLSLLLAIVFATAGVAVSIRERKRESSIRQLLRSLPLKDRLLGRYPRDLLEGPLPSPVPPRLPDRAMAALTLLIINGVTVLVLGTTASLFLQIFLFQIPPGLNGLPQWLSWLPIVVSMICSAFLFAGSILIWTRRYISGGIIGIIFGALTIYLLTGALGIIGGALALTSREST